MLLIGGLIAAVVFTISTVSFINFKSESVNKYTHSLETKSFLISKAVEQKIDRIFDVLNAVAAELDITADEQLDPDAVLASITSIADNFEVMGSHISMKNGDIYASLAGGFVSAVNAKEAGREWYVRIFEGEDRVLTKVYTNGEGNLAIAVSVPVIRDGKRVALLAVNIKVDLITQFINELSGGQDVFVSREDGYLLAAKTQDMIGKNLYQERPSYSQFKSSDTSTHNYEFEGESYFVASARIPSLGWNVWTFDSEENINSASNHNLIITMFIALVFIIVTLIVVYILVNRLLYKPVGGEPDAIEAIVQKIAAGDLSDDMNANRNVTGIYKAIIEMVSNLKTMIEQINATSADVTESSSQIQQTAQGVTDTAEQQMQQLEQTASAMSEMSASVEEVARNAQIASSAAIEANNQAREGMGVVSDMNQDINVMVTGIDEVKEVINSLAKQTENIGSILDVIQGVAEQTNLLALNAAIEAARAGEQGRGFAVVADEVRNLANRTQQSTDEIQQVINGLQEEAKRSVSLMESNSASAEKTANKSAEANNALEAINHAVEEIQNMNTQIATAAEEQTNVAEEVSTSLVALNDMAKSTFDNAHSNSGLSEKLKDYSVSLNSSVDKFSI